MDSETAVKKSSKDNNSPKPISVVEENTPISHENRKDDAEISIFEAHKYFSEECTESPPPPPLHQKPPASSISPVDGFVKTISFCTTTPASSEASWNSRIAARKRWSAAKKWLLRRNCCCVNDKSVLVNDEGGPITLIDDQKLTQISKSFVEIHHIKALAPNPATAATSSIDVPCQQRITARGRPFIDSAVGFTFPVLTTSVTENHNPLEKIFLEALPLPPRRTPSMGSPAGREDDGASDASSDLFEIESLSTLTSGPIHCWWESLEEVSNGERKSAAAVRPLPEEGGEGKTNGNESTVMSCREEKAAAPVKCMAEGAAVIPVSVGGDPPRESSHAPPLRLAYVA